MVRLPGGAGRIRVDDAQPASPPVEGRPSEIADVLRGFAGEGIGHVQLVLDPITLESIRTLEPLLVELDGG